MTRLVYALLWWIAAPLAVLRLFWRARKLPGYATHIGERFGRYDAVPQGPRIWIHAVSVGETRAAAPIVEALSQTKGGKTPRFMVVPHENVAMAMAHARDWPFTGVALLVLAILMSSLYAATRMPAPTAGRGALATPS